MRAVRACPLFLIVCPRPVRALWTSNRLILTPHLPHRCYLPHGTSAQRHSNLAWTLLTATVSCPAVLRGGHLDLEVDGGTTPRRAPRGDQNVSINMAPTAEHSKHVSFSPRRPNASSKPPRTSSDKGEGKQDKKKRRTRKRKRGKDIRRTSDHICMMILLTIPYRAIHPNLATCSRPRGRELGLAFPLVSLTRPSRCVTCPRPDESPRTDVDRHVAQQKLSPSPQLPSVVRLVYLYTTHAPWPTLKNPSCPFPGPVLAPGPPWTDASPAFCNSYADYTNPE